MGVIIINALYVQYLACRVRGFDLQNAFGLVNLGRVPQVEIRNGDRTQEKQHDPENTFAEKKKEKTELEFPAEIGNSFLVTLNIVVASCDLGIDHAIKAFSSTTRKIQGLK